MKLSLNAIRNGVSLQETFAKLPKIPTASAISGLIVAALILMTPNPWFEAFIVESGLPSIISAAEPPLGARARIVFALIAALIVTLGAWVTLTFVTSRNLRARTEAQYDYDLQEAVVQNPRTRRMDAHPDAPYRRPIMAGDDLGVPMDDVTIDSEMPGDPDPELEPLDLGEVAEMLESEPVIADSEVREEVIAEEVSLEFPAEPEIVEEPDVQPEPIFEISLPRHDEAREDVSPITSPPHREPEEAAPLAQSSDAKSKLADLVAQLEAGLERKYVRAGTAPQSFEERAPENVATHPHAQPPQDKDAALREALSALQKVSGTQG